MTRCFHLGPCLFQVPLTDSSKWQRLLVRLVQGAMNQRFIKSAAVGGDILTSIQHLAPARPYARDCTYNLFRNRQRPEILCAVPEDHPVPNFLGPEEWVFEQAL